MGDELCRELRRLKRLETAWKRVRDNGRKSRSKRTRSEIEEFGEDIQHHLRSIQSQLGHDSFRFEPSRGWAEPPKSAGKSHRPIVISPVRSRIVTRSVLDVLLEQPCIQQYIRQPFSFGGIQRDDLEGAAAVPGAIQAAVGAVLEGKSHFIRSDISGFFRKIPKPEVLRKISSCIADQKFCQVIEQAATIELDNLEELRQHADLFPLEDIGVAQGCALSLLFGNILLSDFEQKLNDGNCTCIRYIDDFLIVGPTEKAVQGAFVQAITLLDEFNMEAYDPASRPDKAEQGNICTDRLEFLGVEIMNGSIRPSRKNRGKLIGSIDQVIQDHTKRAASDKRQERWGYDHSYMKCLMIINAIVSGWGNQYYFCNDRKIMDDLDNKITEKVLGAGDRFRRLMDGLSPIGRRRMLGVKSLHDCKVEPITWNMAKSA